MKLTMGKHDLEMGERYLDELRDSTADRKDMPALRSRLQDEGYLLIRGLHDRQKVREARRVVLENLEQAEQLAPGASLMDGVIAEGKRGKFYGGSKAVTHTPEFLDVVEAPTLMQFFAEYLEGPSLTYDFKWLRVVPSRSVQGVRGSGRRVLRQDVPAHTA